MYTVDGRKFTGFLSSASNESGNLIFKRKPEVEGDKELTRVFRVKHITSVESLK